MSISDSAAINQISRFAYQAILNIQQQQPELLNEKYRKVQWSNTRNQSVFLDKLNEELSNVQDWDARLLKVRRFLQVFLFPNSLETLVVSDFLQKIRAYVQQQIESTVYLVRRQGDMITVFNSQTGQTQTHSLIPVPEIPSLEQFITQLKDLIRSEQARTGKFWIKLARLSSLFQSTYKLTISEIVSVHFSEKRAREIFSDFPEDFAVHQLPGQSELYVTLFEINPPNTATQPNTGTSKESQAKALLLMKVESKAELEQVLFRILRALTAKSPGSYVPISNLATEFQKQYSVSITNAIRHLQLGNKFPQVLQSFRVFKLKKVERMYYVSVRAEAIAVSKPQEASPYYSSVSDRKLVGTPEASAEQPSVAQPEKQGGA